MVLLDNMIHWFEILLKKLAKVDLYQIIPVKPVILLVAICWTSIIGGRYD
jgi:hypothetical protein